MKKLLILLVLMPFMTWADTEVVAGVTWTYYWINGDEAEICGANPSTGSLTIPSTLGGRPVKHIGSSAFRDCSGLTSVTIPSSVTRIDWCAFEGCSGLTSVTIPSSVTYIGSSAFRDCSGLKSFSVAASNPTYASINGLLCSKDGKELIAGINGDVKIPPSVTDIWYGAFFGYSGLTSVTIPEGVISIDGGAFYGCGGLNSVTIPSSVLGIGGGAFCDCYGLTSVVFKGTAPKVWFCEDGFCNIFGDSDGNLHSGLIVYVPKNSLGWSAPYSTKLPDVWYGAKIQHSEDTVDWSGLLTAIGAASAVQPSASSSYSLSGSETGNAKISSMTVSADVSIGSFELVDGKVMDMAIRIVNTASSDIRLRLPTGYTYETIGNGNPLVIPANSTSMVTITQTSDTTFLVARQKLSVIQQ